MILEKETNLYLDDAIKNKFQEQEAELSLFINETFAPEISSIQSQVDSKIETWYQPTDPSVSWDTSEKKTLHIGDLWYNTDNGANTTSRWDGTMWVAQNVPSAVFDVIDSKAQVFVTRPVPPYSIGDLWVQGYTGHILRCNTSRSSGTFVANDWEVASKYTDDSVFNNWLTNTFAPTINDISGQLDQKAETWYQADDPSLEWTDAQKTEHIGDLWYSTYQGTNTTYRYDGTTWVEQAAPKAVFDAIDGKAQIFITEPTVPYSKGDLYFKSSTSEILTCIVNRPFGVYHATDWAKRNKYTDDSALTQFMATTYQDGLNYLQTQIDGKIQTWYQPTDPSIDWTTQAEKLQHAGDLWYNSTPGVERYYRWKSEPSKYLVSRTGKKYTTRTGNYLVTAEVEGSWEELTANPPAEIFDTLDSKAQIFITEPVPPYEVGDLWAQGATGDILRCKVARASGVFNENDWELASKYTDDSALNNWLQTEYHDTIAQIETQMDQKAETWYQDVDPANDWTSEELKRLHIGDIWFDSSIGQQSTSQKCWRWTGSTWEELKTMPPASVIDTIDGKAQVFTSQPYTPYQQGDLWCNSDSGEILTCTHTRETGTYTASDWEKLNDYTDDSALTTFLTGDYANTINDINGQLDRKAETWYQDSDPSITWTTAQAKQDHIGDLWYKTSNGVTSRWNGTGWQQQNIPTAVFDAIDGKAQIFTSTPTPPYNLGDLWFDSAQSNIMVCINANATRYVASDWAKRDKYTDDSALEGFLQNEYQATIQALQEQADEKAETWYQPNDPSRNWAADEKANHIGDVWYNSSSDSGKYYMWDGTGWNEMKTTPPQSIMDSIDGKAQIFINTPTTPYSRGDLWFNSDTSDIMTCITDRASGSYNANDWAKRNKYTDNTVADDAIAKLGARYGTSDSTASTVVKVVTLPGFKLFTGAQISVKFTYKNTVANPQLNVNNTGAKYIRAYGNYLTQDSTYNWNAKAVVDFIYDGTDWILSDSGSMSKVDNLNALLNQEEVFNRLTNNGGAQGIQLDENGQLYINFSYARGGTLKLGGLNNTNGVLQVQDASGTVIATINNNGLTINKGSISLNGGRFAVNSNGDLTAMSLTAYGSLICYENYTIS
jgi:phage-related protein